MSANTIPLAAAAMAYLKAGYAPLPTTSNKYPQYPDNDETIAWKQYQTAAPDPEQVARWFTHQNTGGLCLVLAPRPGGLACLDFDNAETYEQVDADICRNDDSLQHTWKQMHRWHERTPRGGVHLFAHVDTPDHKPPKLPQIDALGIGKASVVRTAPTPGYTVNGGPETVATIETDDLYELLDYLQGTLCPPETEPIRSEYKHNAPDENPDMPGSVYNARGDHAALLRSHGWHLVRNARDVEHWRRPGKDDGISATFGYGGVPLFHCFTSSVDDLEADRTYNRFQLYAALEHRGDYRSAAKQLEADGYGTLPKPVTATSTIIGPNGEIIGPDRKPDTRKHTNAGHQNGPQQAEPQNGHTDTPESETEPTDDPTTFLRPAGSDDVMEPVAADILQRRAFYEQTGHSIRGHSTGFPALDDMLGGLEPGRVTLFQAEPAAGKTLISNQIAYQLAANGVPVLYLTFENEPADLIRKHVARIADVSPRRLDRGTLDIASDGIGHALDIFQQTAQTLYYLDGDQNTGEETLRGALAYLNSMYPDRRPVLFVDYLQKLGGAMSPGREDLFAMIGRASSLLTKLAKQYRAHVWAITSLNRQAYASGSNNGKSMAGGKGSGDLEYDAAAVITLVKGDEYSAPNSHVDVLNMHVVKNRYGPGGPITLHRNTRSLAVEEAPGGGVIPGAVKGGSILGAAKAGGR